MVTYVNKKGQKKTYKLSEAIDSGDQELSKRLKYTKDILTQMLSSNNAASPVPPTAHKQIRSGRVSGMAKTQTRFGAGLTKTRSGTRFDTAHRDSSHKFYRTNYAG